MQDFWKEICDITATARNETQQQHGDFLTSMSDAIRSNIRRAAAKGDTFCYVYIEERDIDTVHTCFSVLTHTFFPFRIEIHQGRYLRVSWM